MPTNLSRISSGDCVSRQDITSTGGDAGESLAPCRHLASISDAAKQERGLPCPGRRFRKKNLSEIYDECELN